MKILRDWRDRRRHSPRRPRHAHPTAILEMSIGVSKSRYVELMVSISVFPLDGKANCRPDAAGTRRQAGQQPRSPSNCSPRPAWADAQGGAIRNGPLRRNGAIDVVFAAPLACVARPWLVAEWLDTRERRLRASIVVPHPGLSARSGDRTPRPRQVLRGVPRAPESRHHSAAGRWYRQLRRGQKARAAAPHHAGTSATISQRLALRITQDYAVMSHAFQAQLLSLVGSVFTSSQLTVVLAEAGFTWLPRSCGAKEDLASECAPDTLGLSRPADIIRENVRRPAPTTHRPSPTSLRRPSATARLRCCSPPTIRTAQFDGDGTVRPPASTCR